jgi:FtsZ-interacting cell division protein ZipA
MDTGTILMVVGAIVVVALVALLVWAASRKRRTQQLRERFGPEYERTVESAGDRRKAEEELARRERRRQQLDIRPLDRVKAEQYMDEWRRVQSRFVDAPEEAVNDADRLVTAVMHERGYPMDEFEQRAEDISVDHPDVVNDYRRAHRIAGDSRRGSADTEALRDAMVRYRALFDRLLEIRPTSRRGEDQ